MRIYTDLIFIRYDAVLRCESNKYLNGIFIKSTVLRNESIAKLKQTYTIDSSTRTFIARVVSRDPDPSALAMDLAAFNVRELRAL